MRPVRVFALAMLLVFAAGATSAWVLEEPCVVGQVETDTACSPLCLTCTCCTQPRLDQTTLQLLPPATVATTEAAAPARPQPHPARKIPHVPKAYRLG